MSHSIKVKAQQTIITMPRGKYAKLWIDSTEL